MTLKMHFGALCKPIADQLLEQGYSISEKDGAWLQDLADSIIMLKLHGILPDSVVLKSEQKLMKKIINCESFAEKEP